jgi:hypothetical protein
MRPVKLIAVAGSVAMLSGVGASASPGRPVAAAKTAGLSAVRAATSKYHSVTKAKADGYGVLKDAAGIACIDKPGEGGMGVHYVKPKLVGDGAVKATTPEALVYERKSNGALRMVANEWVVFQDAWDKAHASPPKLFGRTFELVPEGNRYGLPAFYELHAWLYKTNPSGMFADWNPNVTC